jgi:hypothetical protein
VADSLFSDTSVASCRYLAIPAVLLGRHGELIYAGHPDAMFEKILDHTMTKPTAQ